MCVKLDLDPNEMNDRNVTGSVTKKGNTWMEFYPYQCLSDVNDIYNFTTSRFK